MDNNLLPTLKKQTLVDDFITQFEKMIISGQLAIGEKLPSERDLAAKLGVSRPVVHSGLIDLAVKGLITRSSRGGAIINDYRYEGSLTMLDSLLRYNDGAVDLKLAQNTLDFRLLVEVEFARLAARNRTEEQLDAMQSILIEEAAADVNDRQSIAQIDFRLHHLIALATDNIFYPLLLNSFKDLYINGALLFFAEPSLTRQVFKFHIQLVENIAARNEQVAAEVMQTILNHGKENYLKLVSE